MKPYFGLRRPRSKALLTGVVAANFAVFSGWQGLDVFHAILGPAVLGAQLRITLLLNDWTNSNPSFVASLPQVTKWIGLTFKALSFLVWTLISFAISLTLDFRLRESKRTAISAPTLVGEILAMMNPALAWFVTTSLVIVLLAILIPNEMSDQWAFMVLSLLVPCILFCVFAGAASFGQLTVDRKSRNKNERESPENPIESLNESQQSGTLRVVPIAQEIRIFECDRGILGVVGILVSWLPGLTVFFLLFMVTVGMLLMTVSPISELSAFAALLVPIALASLAAPILALLIASIVYGLYGQYRKIFLALLLVAIAVTAALLVAEPFRISAIGAEGDAAAGLKQTLFNWAILISPIGILFLLAVFREIWVHALRAKRFTQPQRSHSFKVGLSAIFGIPRIALHQSQKMILPISALVLASLMATPARVAIPAVLSTGVLGAFYSPLAAYKFDLANMNAKCDADLKSLIEFPKIVSPCAERRENTLFHHGLTWFNPAFWIGISFIGVLGAMLAQWGTARTAAIYRTQAPKDARAPILYLRPFREDRRALSWRPRLLLSSLVPRLGESRSVDEIVLNSCVTDGPVLAIGRPGEVVPPLGAARVYVDGEDWQSVVKSLASSSRYLVLVVDPTAGVLWEIEHSIIQGWYRKTLYVLTSLEHLPDRWHAIEKIAGSKFYETTTNLRPVALFKSSDAWVVLMARFDDRYAVETAIQLFQDALDEPRQESCDHLTDGYSNV